MSDAPLVQVLERLVEAIDRNTDARLKDQPLVRTLSKDAAKRYVDAVSKIWTEEEEARCGDPDSSDVATMGYLGADKDYERIFGKDWQEPVLTQDGHVLPPKKGSACL